MYWLKIFSLLYLVTNGSTASVHDGAEDHEMEALESLIMNIGAGERVKRDSGDKGVT